ncbi:Lysophospholipid transporter LplT / 2-acylglycerophosphoethanolamine acyltransferase / Acyl-[acyl-carrier-protein] synthetase [hydrothermal vent metagenome]|uniref:Lysophospholipid transporter LplT / 2-acylglycerophosphoethanolamine acyltransferase / Acyl-[acyl-carrier-protein] synthetase n=1 Tax=hydrothermal vent metagenome TaxID=652676 RepID=A0A3B1AIQ6_9ZZZZ
MGFKSVFCGKTVFQVFVDAAKKYGSSEPIVEDAVGGSATYKKLLIGARVLGKRFAAITEPGEFVPVLLPNANAVVVTILGLQSAGRVPAMLNYTAGPATVLSSCKTVKAKTVIASRAFVEKAELENLVSTLENDGLKFLWLEDVRASISIVEKLMALLFWKKAIAPSNEKDPAIVLYTSGSEGDPKAVVLSHDNILSNCSQINQRVKFNASDKVFNVLPVFHSFGQLGGMVLPLVFGVRLYLYPSPLHYKIIPKAAAKTRPTVLFGTDTFLTGYARTAIDDDFSSLRLVVAGAEAVKADTKTIWKERFGAVVLEGFGMTEAAPVVAVNTPQEMRHGSVGKLLPGIETRLEPVEGIDEGGRLWIKGPNIMLGYMKADNPGVLQPLVDGWHDSGDIVHIDNDGYVSIRGRAKRFAKIAGEMVSLGAVEIMAHGLWPEENHAVVCVPDKRKGERVVLITTSEDAERNVLSAQTKEKGLSELMVPNSIVKVDDIPMLGSGKTDYNSAQKIAMKLLGIDDR